MILMPPRACLSRSLHISSVFITSAFNSTNSYLPSEVIFKSLPHQCEEQITEAMYVSVRCYPLRVVHIGDRGLARYGQMTDKTENTWGRGK